MQPAPNPVPVEPAQSAQTADLAAILSQSQALEVLDALDRELIGLLPVKTRVREIAALLVVERARAQLGLSTGASLPLFLSLSSLLP